MLVARSEILVVRLNIEFSIELLFILYMYTSSLWVPLVGGTFMS